MNLAALIDNNIIIEFDYRDNIITELEEAKIIINKTYEEAKKYYNERGSLWQEGEEGEAYLKWLDNLNDNIIGINEVVDTLENLPTMIKN